jgi:quercetin dioxygenase-like cupin family protein
MATQIHADRGQRALVHGASLPWVASPEPGVERRMLERVGGEVAVASTIVRYAQGSFFSPHTHALGEEFIVLDGIFSDEEGDYPPGTYVRNPPGSKHAPFSREGCIIFVKLRQMQTDEVESVRLYANDRKWAEVTGGYERALLYSNGRISVWIERAKPGGRVPPRSMPGGEEVFVLSGTLQLLEPDRPVLDAWSWLRQPGDQHPEFVSETGASWWVKRGHLP